MLNFPEQKGSDPPLYIEDTDVDLPEQINPKTRYAFFSTIAEGGKSLIKSCQDLHLKRTVCYKTLRSELIDDPIETKRLLREARISANLQHPNTLPTYEVGRTNRGHYYFTMKLVHGYTLREVLDYRERYDLTQLMEVITQVAHALAYAHSKGVLHRDIKPDNILVGPYGEVLLLDWGLAKVWHKGSKEKESALKSAISKTEEAEIEEADADSMLKEKSMTGEGKLQGSVMYMSPEQVERDPSISFQSDIYSLGALIYESLTGLTPFQGDRVQTLLTQIQTQTPEDPRNVINAAVPDILANLAMKCLAKSPDDRPSSADEIVRILKQAW